MIGSIVADYDRTGVRGKAGVVDTVRRRGALTRGAFPVQPSRPDTLAAAQPGVEGTPCR